MYNVQFLVHYLSLIFSIFGIWYFGYLVFNFLGFSLFVLVAIVV